MRSMENRRKIRRAANGRYVTRRCLKYYSGLMSDAKKDLRDAMADDYVSAIEQDNLAKIAEYAARGRPLQNDSTEALLERYIALFRAMVVEFPPTRQTLDNSDVEDVQNELLLRKVPLPKAELAAETELLQSRVRDELAKIASDPRKVDIFGRKMKREIQKAAQHRGDHASN